MQRLHYNTNFTKKEFPIVLLCDGISNAPNLGSLFRLADAFGISEIILCGEPLVFGKRMKKTSRSTEKYVSFRQETDALRVLSELQQKNFTAIALEIATFSKPLHEFVMAKKAPIVLIIGNENHGVSDDLLRQSDIVLHIEMYGNNSSMNVTHAAAIALYELTKKMSVL